MSRKLFLGVAAGATVLMALTGCSQQVGQAGQAGTGGPAGVCGLLAAPVTAVLVQNGITATPVNDGGSSACRWQDPSGTTTVTLTTVDSTEKDGQAPSTTVPGVGEVRIIGAGEVTFTAGGRAWELKVSSPADDEVDTTTATGLCATVGSALGGGAAPVSPGSTRSANAGTEQKDSTVTVTDTDGRTTDLRSSDLQLGDPDGIDLGNGQTVSLSKIARVEFSDIGSVSDKGVTITLTDGSTVEGKMFVYLAVEGKSDIGAFRLLVSKLATVEFRRDAPFVTTPDPQLSPWNSTTVVVTETTGTTSQVKAPSLIVLSDPVVTLDNGQSVSFEKVARIDATQNGSSPTYLDITLVNGTTFNGTIDPHLSIDGDTDNGHLSTTTDKLTSITIDRGAGIS